MPTAAAAASGAVAASYADDIPDSVKSFVTGLYDSTRDGENMFWSLRRRLRDPRAVRGRLPPPLRPPLPRRALATSQGRRALLQRRPRLPPPLQRAHVPPRPRAPPRPHPHAPRRLLGQLLLPLRRRPQERRHHAAAQPVALGHGRWVREPVPGILPVPHQTRGQDRGGDQPTRAAWNVHRVLNYLEALVKKSMIREILEKEEGLEQFTMMNEYDYRDGGESNVLKMLGYYSMIGLLKVHCLIGDYHTGLKCLLPIDISQQGFYTTVTGSLISTIYYYGFANFMMHRYADAIRQFNRILLYILKYKQYHQKSPQYDLLLKKNDQMYALLAICLSLCPLNNLIDENVSIELKGKYGTEMEKMLKCDGEKCYDELFSFACPKFIAAWPPVLKEPFTNYNQDVYRLQLKLFLDEVKQKQLLGGIRSSLKLFSVITIGKLAQHMGLDEITLRTILLAYTHKTHAVDNCGKITSSADFDFYIDEETIHATEWRSFRLNVGRARISNYTHHLFSWPNFSISIPYFRLGWAGQGPVWPQRNSAPATESKSIKHHNDYFLTHISKDYSLKKYISFGQPKAIFSRTRSLQPRQFRQSRVCRARVSRELEKQAEELTRKCLLQYDSLDMIRDHMGVLLRYLQSSQILISQEQEKLFQLKGQLSESLGLCSQVDQIKELFDENISKLKKSCKEIGLTLKALTDALHVNFNGDPLLAQVNDIHKRNIECSKSAAAVVLKYHDHMEREKIELSWFTEPANEVERLSRLLSDYSSKSIELEKSFSQQNKEIDSLSEERPHKFDARFKALKKWANMLANVDQLSKKIIPFAEAVEDQCMICIDLSTLFVQKASYCKRFFNGQEYFSSAIPKLNEKLEELWHEINQAWESYMEKMGELPEKTDVPRNYESSEHITKSWRTRLYHNRNIMAPFRYQGKDMCTYVSTVAMTESLNKREHTYYLKYVGNSKRHTHLATKLSEDHLQDIVREYFANNTIKVRQKLQVCFEKMKKTGVVSEKTYDLGVKDGCHRHKISGFEKLEPHQFDKAFAILDTAKVLVGTFSITPGYFNLKPDDIYSLRPKKLVAQMDVFSTKLVLDTSI